MKLCKIVGLPVIGAEKKNELKHKTGLSGRAILKV